MVYLGGGPKRPKTRRSPSPSPPHHQRRDDDNNDKRAGLVAFLRRLHYASFSSAGADAVSAAGLTWPIVVVWSERVKCWVLPEHVGTNGYGFACFLDDQENPRNMLGLRLLKAQGFESTDEDLAVWLLCLVGSSAAALSQQQQ